MCKIVGREGTTRLVVIPALVWKISQENERGGGGLEIAPHQLGRGLSANKANESAMAWIVSLPFVSIISCALWTIIQVKVISAHQVKKVKQKNS